MQISFVLPTVSLSGGIRVVGIHARWLARRGHVVTLVSPPQRAPSLGTRLRLLARGEGWPAAHGASHLDGSGLDHRVLGRWRPVKDADLPDADVVVATWWETAEWVAALAPRKGAKAYFIQGHEVFPYLPVERCRATYRLPMHKIVVARWLRDLMESDYGDPIVDVVPNSVDPGQFFALERARQSQPTVGILYSSASVKGVDVALSAIARVQERFPQLRIVAFGSERPSPRLPLPPGAWFEHAPPQPRIRELYSQCDAWLTASRSEGFNLPAMEAMACGTPVVATRTGWPAEALIPGESGWLGDIDDIGGLAAGLKWVLTRPDSSWRELSRRAVRAATAGSWQQSSQQFERALLRACRRAQRGEIGGRPASAAMEPRLQASG